MINKNHLGVYFLLALCLVIVCLPRFNRRNIEGVGDAGVYTRYIEYFRGKTISSPILAPLNFRPFAPFIAASLPFDPMTAINIINIFMCAIMLYFMMHVKSRHSDTSAAAKMMGLIDRGRIPTWRSQIRIQA